MENKAALVTPIKHCVWQQRPQIDWANICYFHIISEWYAEQMSSSHARQLAQTQKSPQYVISIVGTEQTDSNAVS